MKACVTSIYPPNVKYRI